MSNKNQPRIYWDENRECYYITFFEDTKCDEIVDAFEKFKGRTPKQQKEEKLRIAVARASETLDKFLEKKGRPKHQITRKL